MGGGEGVKNLNRRAKKTLHQVAGANSNYLLCKGVVYVELDR